MKTKIMIEMDESGRLECAAHGKADDLLYALAVAAGTIMASSIKVEMPDAMLDGAADVWAEEMKRTARRVRHKQGKSRSHFGGFPE